MKLFFRLSIIFLFVTACGGSQPSAESTDTSEQTDTIVTLTADTILLYQGAIEYGMDEYFYLLSENGDSLTGEIREAHVVPQIIEGDGDSSEIFDFMFGFVANDFDLHYTNLKNFSGKMRVFYDANRTRPMTEYIAVDGKPHGPVNVYSPEGNLIISRNYENGVCVSSIQDLYAIDWTFNPVTSQLEIQKFAAYKKTDDDGNTLIELGESMHPDKKPFRNNLYELIQKPVFENTFTLNGQAFTGTLIGYYAATYAEQATEYPYFELVFLDGKLHDTIRLYNEWGELQLEEKFESGVLTETIYELDYSEMDGMAKPVIYLYPETDLAVNLQLNLKGEITHSYPKYPEGGWNVLAKQNGTIYDLNGKEFYALFWEGVSPVNYTYADGFVIAGNETEKFLENSLEILGLNRREANEFIMYWLPQMEDNVYNLIHFSTTEYEKIATLKITPEPESLIRIMMVWSPLIEPIEIPQQNLYDLRTERKGFTVVEWGGKRQDFQQDF